MVMQFQCPCGQKLRTPDATVGNRGRCPKCGVWLLIPLSSSFEMVAEVDDLAVVEKEASAASASGRKPAPAVPPKGCLLLADANAEYLARHATMLRDHGYAVLEASEGDAIVEMIRNQGPDAAIVDVHLATYSGFHVVERVLDPLSSKDGNVWHMPILMTASTWRGRDKQYAISLGVKGCFYKPLVAAEFFPKLETLMRTYRPH